MEGIQSFNPRRRPRGTPRSLESEEEYLPRRIFYSREIVYYEPHGYHIKVICEPQEKPMQLSIKQDLLNELQRLIIDTKMCFDDIRNRQIFFSDFKRRFKESLEDIWSFTTTDDFSRNLIVHLESAIDHIKAEELTTEKLDAFEDILSRLKRNEVSEEDVEASLNLLINKKLRTVTPIKDIAKYYED